MFQPGQLVHFARGACWSVTGVYPDAWAGSLVGLRAVRSVTVHRQPWLPEMSSPSDHGAVEVIVTYRSDVEHLIAEKRLEEHLALGEAKLYDRYGR